MTAPGEDRPAPGDPGDEESPHRGRTSLLARNPVLAVVALLLGGWLLVDLWPDLVFFLAPLDPIDLGAPGAYRLQEARENRLVQIRGELVQAIPVTEARSGAPRTVGRIAGTNLVVDRPGRGGPAVFEGRLLPAARSADYAAAVAAMRARGADLGDRWMVLRDGERPRRNWIAPAGSAILALLALVNLRALVKHLTD